MIYLRLAEGDGEADAMNSIDSVREGVALAVPLDVAVQVSAARTATEYRPERENFMGKDQNTQL